MNMIFNVVTNEKNTFNIAIFNNKIKIKGVIIRDVGVKVMARSGELLL